MKETLGLFTKKKIMTKEEFIYAKLGFLAYRLRDCERAKAFLELEKVTYQAKARMGIESVEEEKQALAVENCIAGVLSEEGKYC